MALAENPVLPHENLQANEVYGYSHVLTSTQESSVCITFDFSGLPEEFRGEKQSEHKAFLQAAKKAWLRYRRSNKHHKFVRDNLEDKWKDLNGEKVTKIKLSFNRENDEIY